jgi:adenylate cyclase
VDATAVPALTPPATAPLEAADHSSSEGPVLRQQASPAEEAEFELAFWESIKDSREPAEFAAYLERYPAGTFAALAETRRQTLLEEAAVTAADPAAADAEVSAVDVLRLP